MNKLREAGYFVLGFALSLACATTQQYKYYGMNLSSDCYTSGSLLGKQGSDGWPDLPLSDCAPDAQVKGKCAIQLASDFFAKDKALADCQQQLSDCQANK